jgi:tRNA(His) 5'-end guanylyltransferase
MEKPFDDRLIFAMKEALKYVCDNVMGCVLWYTQSDEASLVITDTMSIESEWYFDFNIQKLCSVISSMYTYKFNNEFRYDKPAIFDCRVFTIPKEEIGNYFVWRQRDWERNSLQMLSQAHFSHKQLHWKKTKDMHDMLHWIGVNWNNLDKVYKNWTYYNEWEFSYERHTRETINNLIS